MTIHTPEQAQDPRTVFLADYQPYPYILSKVALTFRLNPTATEVQSALHFAPNPARPGRHDLPLDGEGLQLLSCQIAGRDLTPEIGPEGMVLRAADLPEGAFVLTIGVRIAPVENTALEGLYMSNGMYCTQCEPQGFRKITYYPDRPDVMARFSVRIESDLPVLLSNGNATAQGQGWAEWDDPWPKPAYLFALVAGDLHAHSGRFTTKSGRDVALNIWVRDGDQDRCAYGMGALIRSMRWDEDVYGREYDLDIFNIVAVDDFNMGAMENKGLNIFNSKVVLANSAIATDEDFARIEAIIAHEYFHNWTGNRITCRDWFQLCLKEGLTVFRDHQFSADMRGHAVKRIDEVVALRARQFREDGGPLAHAVRPASFVEINNFYTATIYEKGSEIIGMLKQLVGDADYARALDLYFDRHDGQAATLEDWIKVFEDTTGRDLTQFTRWYFEAGTPRVTVTEQWEPAATGGRFSLTLSQSNPPTPGQAQKGAKVIPVAVGLLNPNGDEVRPTEVLELTQDQQTFHFDGLASRPVASILRGFSAPVVLQRDLDDKTRAFLLAHDTDAFNRWEAGRDLAKTVLGRMVQTGAAPLPDYLDAIARLVTDATLDPAFRALVLRLPSDDDMASTLAANGQVADPARIHTARKDLTVALAARLAPDLPRLVQSLQSTGPFAPDAEGAGRRALRLAALSLLARLDSGQAARACFAQADNMTESFGALAVLLDIGQGAEELAAFAARWSGDRLVMDKWFGVQVLMADPDHVADITRALVARPDFDLKNPNRFRAVFGSLAAHHAGFHHISGSGYRLLADWVITLDALNPQTAARVSGAFETWARYDANRQAMIRAELARIKATAGLSRDLTEMVTRMLGA